MEKKEKSSLKDVIWQLYQLAQKDGRLAEKRDSFLETKEELEEKLSSSTEMEWVDFIRLKDARTLLAMLFADWGAQLEDYIYAVKWKPYYKSMMSEHRGVVNFATENVFSKLFVDRYSLSESIQIGSYRVRILKQKKTPATLKPLNDSVLDGRWYKRSAEGAFEIFIAKPNPVGEFLRVDGNCVIHLFIQRKE